jgi:hypothetical protein
MLQKVRGTAELPLVRLNGASTIARRTSLNGRAKAWRGSAVATVEMAEVRGELSYGGQVSRAGLSHSRLSDGVPQ